MIGRTSGARKFNNCKFSNAFGLRSIEKIISERDDLVVDALFFFCDSEEI